MSTVLEGEPTVFESIQQFLQSKQNKVIRYCIYRRMFIVLSVLVLFQSCAAGVGNAVSESGEVSGSAGFIVAIILLAGGIVMIATRNSTKKGGAIACIILFLFGALIGFANAGSYSDLRIWSGLCVILAVINIISMLVKKKEKDSTDS